MRNFLWTGDILKKKLVTVAWHIVCTPKFAGGLGIRILSSMNKAAILKQVWGVLKVNSLWSQFVRGRFHIINTSATITCKVSSI